MGKCLLIRALTVEIFCHGKLLPGKVSVMEKLCMTQTPTMRNYYPETFVQYKFLSDVNDYPGENFLVQVFAKEIFCMV